MLGQLSHQDTGVIDRYASIGGEQMFILFFYNLICLCVLVLSTAVLCEDPPSTKAPEHPKALDHHSVTNSTKMPEQAETPDGKPLTNFNENN
ncbi:unnamed protein product [Euphydryas editha]|uniref:Uncharacterized protein n=1 Tax=Euphydryas editha TaxID=104508 RepID=A0AAU9TU97_EUPED|nr:unnamed protein product [Euphydryas editha]